MKKEDWMTVFEFAKVRGGCATYDFHYFAHAVLGIDIFDNFLLKMSYEKKQLKGIISTIEIDKGHSHLKQVYETSYEGINQILAIRKSLKIKK